MKPTRDEKDFLVVFLPVFSNRDRAVRLSRLRKRRAVRQRIKRQGAKNPPSIFPLLDERQEEEGLRLLQQCESVAGLESSCALCVRTLFPSRDVEDLVEENAVKGYQKDLLERLVRDKSLPVEKAARRKYCKYCANFIRDWMNPWFNAAGEVSYRQSIGRRLSDEALTLKVKELKQEWQTKADELIDKYKTSGVPESYLTMFRAIVRDKLNREVG